VVKKVFKEIVMILSRYNLKNIQSAELKVPPDSVFDLPEKVLQFGTGVLLRGLPDYFIDKANRKGIFNGRVVIVKSTDGGDASAFEKQDGLYTLCVRGLENGQQFLKTLSIHPSAGYCQQKPNGTRSCNAPIFLILKLSSLIQQK